MKNNIILILSLVLMLVQSLAPSWAVPPPNPTQTGIGGNTAGGEFVLERNTTGLWNTGFGSEALSYNTTGSNNSAFGDAALYNNTVGNYNTAIGLGALFSNTRGNFNAAFGEAALSYNTIGSYNTAIGMGALVCSDKNGNSYNTVLGYNTLPYLVKGNSNLALGANAGISLKTGSKNIYIDNAGTDVESSTIRIGTTQTRAFLSGVRGKTTGLNNAVAVFIDSNGQLGTINSSERFKKDIRDMENASRRLLELRPVTYHYKQSSEDGTRVLEYGLIAEEVAKVYPELVVYGADGKIETVQYHKLTPMLVNEVKRLNSVNVLQAQEIAVLKQEIAGLQTHAREIEALTTRLSRIEANQSLGMAAK